MPARWGTCLPGREFTEFWQLLQPTCRKDLVQTKMGQWVGPRLDPDCSILHTSCTLFKPKLHISTPKIAGGSLNLFIWPSFQYGHIEYTPFLYFSLLFVFCIGVLRTGNWEQLGRLLHEVSNNITAMAKGFHLNTRKPKSPRIVWQMPSRKQKLTWGNEALIGQSSSQESYNKDRK